MSLLSPGEQFGLPHTMAAGFQEHEHEASRLSHELAQRFCILLASESRGQCRFKGRGSRLYLSVIDVAKNPYSTTLCQFCLKLTPKRRRVNKQSSFWCHVLLHQMFLCLLMCLRSGLGQPSGALSEVHRTDLCRAQHRSMLVSSE